MVFFASDIQEPTVCHCGVCSVFDRGMFLLGSYGTSAGRLGFVGIFKKSKFHGNPKPSFLRGYHPDFGV